MKSLRVLALTALTLGSLTPLAHADSCSEFIASLQTAYAPIGCTDVLADRKAADEAAIAAAAEKKSKKKSKEAGPSVAPVDAHPLSHYAEFCRFPWFTALAMTGMQTQSNDPVLTLKHHYGFERKNSSVDGETAEHRRFTMKLLEFQIYFSQLDTRLLEALKSARFEIPKADQANAIANIEGYRNHFYLLAKNVSRLIGTEVIPNPAYPREVTEVSAKDNKPLRDEEMQALLLAELQKKPSSEAMRWEVMIARENRWIDAGSKELLTQFSEANSFHFAYRDGGVGTYHDLDGGLTGAIRIPEGAAAGPELVAALDALAQKVRTLETKIAKCYSSTSMKKDCDYVGLAVETLALENEKVDVRKQVAFKVREHWKTASFEYWKTHQDDQGKSCLESRTAEFCVGAKTPAACAKELATQPEKLWQALEKAAQVDSSGRSPASTRNGAKTFKSQRRQYSK